MSVSRKSSGELIAEVLSGAWRIKVPRLHISADDLERIAPQLMRSGAAALAWRRIRDTDLGISPAAAEFRSVYRIQTLQARMHQRNIEQATKLFRSAGIEPILVKGWAIAQSYPERGLRPSGDIDLCVRPEQYTTARAALKSSGGSNYYVDLVDLHAGLKTFGSGDVEEFFARSQLIRIGETDVRIPAPEDHLRVLSFHLLREGAWRPLWLCDVALALETRPSNFDWEKCFAGTKRNRELVFCALGLAHLLLGAQLDQTPFAAGRERFPSWLVRTVLKEWESPLPSMRRRHATPMATVMNRRAGLRSALGDRWPNAAEATVVVSGPFNEFPRMPFQLGAYLMRATSFLRRLPALSRERNRVKSFNSSRDIRRRHNHS